MNDEERKEIERLQRETNKTLKSRYLDLFGEESRSSNHATCSDALPGVSLPNDQVSRS
jgi:hypothetical protein